MLYSIGHSNRSVEEFNNLIENFDVLVDIRSHPYSKYTVDFNGDTMQKHLKIKYLYMGDLLGGKVEKTLLLPNGKPNYTKIIQTDNFQQGIKRLLTGLEKKYKIVLMCSEKDPMICHRFNIVSKYLAETYKINIQHIIDENTILSHQEVEKQMVHQLYNKLDVLNLTCQDSLLEQAYNHVRKKV